MAIERKIKIHSIAFFDTGWEYPEMYNHIKEVEQYIGRPIIRLSPIYNFKDMLKRYGWPHMCLRWCTGEKMRAMRKYTHANNAISLIGYAADEIKRANGKEQKKRLTRFPLIEWGITEKAALSYCLKKGFTWGGLYNHFKRCSCFCCPLQKLDDFRKIKKFYPVLWQRMLEMEKTANPQCSFWNHKTVQDLDARFS